MSTGGYGGLNMVERLDVANAQWVNLPGIYRSITTLLLVNSFWYLSIEYNIILVNTILGRYLSGAHKDTQFHSEQKLGIN